MYGEVGVINMNNQMNNGQINRGLNQTSVNNGNTNTNSNTVRKMPKQAENNPKYTENWLPLKGIRNGVMYNNKNEMITGVKIQPKNIFCLAYFRLEQSSKNKCTSTLCDCGVLLLQKAKTWRLSHLPRESASNHM